jgi:hypothetical protein
MSLYKKQLHMQLNRHGYSLCPSSPVSAGMFVYTRELQGHLVEVVFSNCRFEGEIKIYENGQENGDPSYILRFPFDAEWLKHLKEVNRVWKEKYEKVNKTN